MSLKDQIMAIERDAYSLVADARGEARKSWDRLTNTRPESLRFAAWGMRAAAALWAFLQRGSPGSRQVLPLRTRQGIVLLSLERNRWKRREER